MSFDNELNKKIVDNINLIINEDSFPVGVHKVYFNLGLSEHVYEKFNTNMILCFSIRKNAVVESGIWCVEISLLKPPASNGDVIASIGLLNYLKHFNNSISVNQIHYCAGFFIQFLHNKIYGSEKINKENGIYEYYYNNYNPSTASYPVIGSVCTHIKFINIFNNFCEIYNIGKKDKSKKNNSGLEDIYQDDNCIGY